MTIPYFIACCAYILRQCPDFYGHAGSTYILLNKNRITTGVLANRAFPWVDLTIPRKSEDTLNYGFLAQAWQQLYLSTYNRSDIRDMEQVHTLLRNGNQEIKLGYIAYTYNAIDTNALLDGRLVMGEEDGLLRDGAGMPSPYNEFSLAAPVIFTEKLGARNHTFYYDPALALDNTPDGEAPAIRIASGAEELELMPGESGELINWLNR